MFNRRTARGWLAAYAVVSVLDVLAVWLDVPALAAFMKPLLMPVLLAFFVASLDGLRHRLVNWVTAALLFSWVGDVLLMGDGLVLFILGLLGFLGAQACYILGFRPYATLGPLRERPWLATPYLAYGVGLLLWILPDLGGLFVPVAVYTTALVTMAVLATGISPTAAVGAILFMVSDSLIALTELSDRLPESASRWIMPTYVMAQLLIVMGVLQNLGHATGVREVASAD